MSTGATPAADEVNLWTPDGVNHQTKLDLPLWPQRYNVNSVILTHHMAGPYSRPENEVLDHESYIFSL